MEKPQLRRFHDSLSSSRPRRLLCGWNSDQVAIERNGPVNRGRPISRDQPVGVLSCAYDAVVAPDAIRLAIQKVHRLQVTPAKDRDEEIAHRADVLHIEDESAGRSLYNLHSVDGLARKAVDLFEVEHLSFLHLIGREVFAALTRQTGQSIGVHN